MPEPPRTLDVADCYRYCEAIARAHHENFPRASFLLPEALRPHVWALYAFVRSADDFADEPEYAGRRGAELDKWEDHLLRAFHGEADHPIFVALAKTVAERDLPITHFSDLLDAFRMDLRIRRYGTWADLNAYVARAAHPIGRLLLGVFGVRDAERLRFGDELAAALALTSFWQDLARDLDRDRIYVPQEDLRHFGLGDAELFARKQTPALAALVRYECARTRAVYERARPLLGLVPGRIALELGLFFHGGLRALARTEANAGDAFAPRQPLSTVDKARALAGAAQTRAAALFGRRG
jgi:hydroxysqualene synthase